MGNPARQLTAGDVMQRDVLTVHPHSTLRDALTMMTEDHVTGLPIMDQQSRCIGLVASSDILNYEAEHADDSTGNRTAQHFDPETQQWGSVPISAFGLEGFGDVEVSEVMTTELIWVARDTPLKEVARRMLDERVHRVLVMDANSHLFGVVSAFNFVRVIAEK